MARILMPSARSCLDVLADVGAGCGACSTQHGDAAVKLRVEEMSEGAGTDEQAKTEPETAKEAYVGTGADEKDDVERPPAAAASRRGEYHHRA
jgi:hypothetical protein